MMIETRGQIIKKQLANAMRLGKLGEQFVRKSKKAFEEISFVGYEIAEKVSPNFSLSPRRIPS